MASNLYLMKKQLPTWHKDYNANSTDYVSGENFIEILSARPSDQSHYNTTDDPFIEANDSSIIYARAPYTYDPTKTYYGQECQQFNHLILKGTSDEATFGKNITKFSITTGGTLTYDTVNCKLKLNGTAVATLPKVPILCCFALVGGGGGGGGGAGWAADNNDASGGGAGATIFGAIDFTKTSSVTLKIGTGGSGGSGSAHGGAGGNSTLSASFNGTTYTLTASGGSGGESGLSSDFDDEDDDDQPVAPGGIPYKGSTELGAGYSWYGPFLIFKGVKGGQGGAGYPKSASGYLATGTAAVTIQSYHSMKSQTLASAHSGGSKADYAGGGGGSCFGNGANAVEGGNGVSPAASSYGAGGSGGDDAWSGGKRTGGKGANGVFYVYYPSSY